MNEAATKIQRAFRRKKEGKSTLLNFKDVMKKLIEAEKAKERLQDVLQTMRDETLRYYYNFLLKHEAKIVRIQAFYRGRLARKRMRGWIEVMRAVSRVGRLADARWRRLFSEKGFQAFKATLYD